jgi:hypothetical protein
MRKTTELRRRRLLQELGKLKVIIRGSYMERYSTCARAQCNCHKGKKHGPRAYVTSGKPQKQHYVPQSQEKIVRQGIKEYRRLIDLADELTELHLELMREGQLDGSKG